MRTESPCILAINGATVTVQQGTAQVAFTTDANTKVTLNGNAATAADLRVGMTLKATTELGVAATIVAKG